MKKIIYMLFTLLLFTACDKEKEVSRAINTPLSSRKVQTANLGELASGNSYLPVYSYIYQINENRTFDLTATVSMRNISVVDTLYILTADYYNTKGEKVRRFIDSPIYILPMETIEIIIDDKDDSGGSGAKFIFNWAIKNDLNEPIFESIMISTAGQQGLSFTSRGVRFYD